MFFFFDWHSEKSIHGCPRRVGVADRPTQLAFFFCSKLVFWDQDMRFSGILKNRSTVTRNFHSRSHTLFSDNEIIETSKKIYEIISLQNSTKIALIIKNYFEGKKLINLTYLSIKSFKYTK